MRRPKRHQGWRHALEQIGQFRDFWRMRSDFYFQQNCELRRQLHLLKITATELAAENQRLRSTH